MLLFLYQRVIRLKERKTVTFGFKDCLNLLYQQHSSQSICESWSSDLLIGKNVDSFFQKEVSD